MPTIKIKSVLTNVKILDGCVYIGAFIEQAGIVRQAGGACKFFFGSKKEKIEYKKIEKILFELIPEFCTGI